MGMRMMFTMILLVVLVTTVVSFTLDRVLGPVSDGRNAAPDDEKFDRMEYFLSKCCANPSTCDLSLLCIFG
uniref:Conotoxin Pl171 n=1 Tax=Conus planorbis TaxID=97183 RepID=CA171_CONPO|nr:RecName: Full=Conotoxin Pl171; Flags: Precursor [Conus planorbis]